MGVGVGATFAAIEPTRQQPESGSHGTTGLRTLRGFADAVIGPFAEFFRVYGWLALLMLAMISLYRLPEFLMGPMANPYYHDLGLSKDTVGAVRASIGLVGSLLGIAAGGLSAVRIGYFRTLFLGLYLQSVGTAAFAILAYTGADVRVFGAIMMVDNFGAAFAGVALVTYMSSLTTMGYTATQYALLSSAYTYVGKFAKGFSGVMVESLAGGLDVRHRDTRAEGGPLVRVYGRFRRRWRRERFRTLAGRAQKRAPLRSQSRSGKRAPRVLRPRREGGPSRAGKS
jgi:PAT family beta-lactamase induction signal transducer AmpG